MSDVIKNTLSFSIGFFIGGIASAIIIRKKYGTNGYITVPFPDPNPDIKCENEDLSGVDYDADTVLGELSVTTDHEDVCYDKLVESYGFESGSKGYYLDQSELASTQEDEEEQYRKYEAMSHKANSYDFDRRPYIISIEQFSDDNEDFDKITVSYYNEDNTLADDNEEIIQDVVGIIGEDALSSFGKGSNDPDVVYVRNEKMRSDYEIINLHKSYSEVVLGIAKKKKRTTRKRKDDETQNTKL